MSLERTKKEILQRIREAKNALACAKASLDKDDFSDAEDQLDIATTECGDALTITEHFVDTLDE